MIVELNEIIKHKVYGLGKIVDIYPTYNKDNYIVIQFFTDTPPKTRSFLASNLLNFISKM